MSAKPSSPDAAPTPADWVAEDNTTTGLEARLGDGSDSTYLWTPALSIPRAGPVVVIVLDDTARVNVHSVVADSGLLAPALSSRIGQRASETLLTRVRDLGLELRSHEVTWGPCWPTRTEIITCLFRKNHHMRLNSGANYTATFVDPAGEYFQLPGRPGPETAGPWGLTLAGVLAPQRVPITNPAHAALLRAGRPDDDVQARTGNWLIELARAGIDLWVGGKWINAWDHTFPIPAGINHCRLQEIDSGSQWSSIFVDYDGANAWDGPGHSGATAVTHNYSRGNGTATWSSANGGRLLISGVTHAFVDPATLDYQQQCTIDSSTNPALNGTYYVAAVTDTTHCELTCTVNPGGTPSSVNVYNREEYPVFRLVNEAIKQLRTSHAAGTPLALYMAPHLTHDTGLGADSYGSSYEKCYEGSCATPAGNGLWFDGIETQVSGTAVSPPSSTTLATFKANAQMMASFGDALGRLIDELEALHGNNWTIILTSDQGDQEGDQTSRGNGNVKTTVWQSSSSPFMYARGPEFQRGGVQMRVSTHADIGLTVLDIFGRTGLFTGLLDNHMHQDRDGCSWLGNGTTRPSIFDPTHPAYNRVVPIYGDWKTQSGEGYVDSNTWQKFMRVEGSATLAKQYDIRLPSDGGDYETAETALSTVTTPTLAHFNFVIAALTDARWNPSTNTNPAHDGTIVA